MAEIGEVVGLVLRLADERRCDVEQELGRPQQVVIVDRVVSNEPPLNHRARERGTRLGDYFAVELFCPDKGSGDVDVVVQVSKVDSGGTREGVPCVVVSVGESVGVGHALALGLGGLEDFRDRVRDGTFNHHTAVCLGHPQ